MAVRVPPHSPVDVDVLHEQGDQQIKKEQELEQHAAVRRQLGDPGVTHRLRGDESRERRGGQTHRVTASAGKRHTTTLKPVLEEVHHKILHLFNSD